mmetsp:Transcript_57327/g.152881  ORF Transcript_57327/g.152881 Transcript_57327/m.152881 type:complete len:87 (+) Transcript_57327:87-347(+)
MTDRLNEIFYGALVPAFLGNVWLWRADACAIMVCLYEWAENAQRGDYEMVHHIEAECLQFCCVAWVFAVLRGGVERVTANVTAHRA